MNRWKTIAMMSMGFTCGVVWTAACGGADSAKADDSGYEDDGSAGAGSGGGGGVTPPPSSHGGARTVFELESNRRGDSCVDYEGRIASDCCPDGFEAVGTAARYNGDYDGHVVCLESI